MGSDRSRTQHVITGLATAFTAAGLITVATATPAAADDVVCGHTITTTDPGNAPQQLQDVFDRAITAEINGVRRTLHLQSVDNCTALREIYDIAAEFAVPGMDELMGFELDLSGGRKVLMAVSEDVAHRLHEAFGEHQDMPAEIPAVGASDQSGPQVSVAWTGGAGLWLNSAPASGQQTVLPDGTTLTLLCQTTGPTFDGAFGPSDIHDRVSTADGTTGYVFDGYVNTGSNTMIAPTC